MKFEKAQLAYEQNCLTFRSLNQLMWQIPLIAMTLTGGLWFGVSKVGDSVIFKLALLFLAAAGNVGLIIVLHRLRFLMGEYLNWIGAYNSEGFVSGDGTGHLDKPHTVRTVFQILLGSAALISAVLIGIMFVESEEIMEKENGSLRSIAYYQNHAMNLADNYESIDFEDAHPAVAEELRKGNKSVLDVGAGSGRDAAWMAAHGNTVVAAEPSEAMLSLARELHADAEVQWVKDSLPRLKHIRETRREFDAILLSAVWMHIQPEHREAALAVLTTILKPNGKIYMTLRKGPASFERGIYHVSVEEVTRLAEKSVLSVLDLGDRPDLMGREQVRWHSLVLSRK